MLGKLSVNSFSHNAIELAAGYSIIAGLLLAVFVLTYFKRWRWLWEEYITSVDPKKIGIMYNLR